MRFFAFALVAAAIPVLAAGCSDPVPETADAAWYVSTTQTSTCKIAGHQTSLGEVNATQKISVVTDGVMGNSVSCSVTGSGTFAVDATAANTTQGVQLQIFIPAITPSATKDNPAKGSVSYLSPKTATTYAGGSCDFFFINKPETVAAGKIWVAFTCDEITAGSAMSTCAIVEGYALFESCLTTIEE